MKARTYTTDDGKRVYCSDMFQGVECPYTGVFVDVIETCGACLNHYKTSDYGLYCLAPKDEFDTLEPKVNSDE